MKPGTSVSKNSDSSSSARLASTQTKNEQNSQKIESNFSVNKEKMKSKPKNIRKRRSRRHSSTSSSSSYEDGVDTEIDEKLQQSAQRNNLTSANVKNILQNVVRNDQVLAIVKLKEEEMEKHEQARKLLTMSQINDDDDTTKLTRAKAKALNRNPLPLIDFHPKPDSEVVALIHDELRSDDEDEEYQPGEEDIESDDDLNTTTSDVDSQPRTPQTPHHHGDPDDDTQRAQYTHDGLFKIPRARSDSTQSEQEYIIAQRTRSKISLAETPIEAIESTLKAPDIPTDFYDNNECDVDIDWMEFLNNFTKPLTQEIEKDEDTDPDYVAADRCLVDKEELRNINVSKRELDDLFNELYESLIDVNLDETSVIASASTSIINTTVTSPPALNTPTKHTNSLTTTSCKLNSSPKTSNQKTKNSTENTTTFNPNVMSTPSVSTEITRANDVKASVIAPTTTTTTTVADTTVDLTSALTYPINPITFSSMNDSGSFVIPLIAVSPFPNVTNTATALLPNNLLSPILISMSPLNNTTTVTAVNTASTITSPTEPSTVLDQTQTTVLDQTQTTVLVQTQTTVLDQTQTTMLDETQAITDLESYYILKKQIEMGAIKLRGSRSKLGRFKNADFKELENLDPNYINTQRYPEEYKGFTCEQLQILEKQLRMHVQLATQTYLQTYGHPEHYSRANDLKEFLTDLDDIVNCPEKPHNISIWNLSRAINLVNKWELDLFELNEENIELVQFHQNQTEKISRNPLYTMRFHERFLSTVCESKVFIYPELLPSRPFRPESVRKSLEYLPAEDYLIAFSLERFSKELKEKYSKFSKPKKLSQHSIYNRISSNFLYLRNAKSISDYVRVRKKSDKMNPIKYYFQHGKAPPYNHTLEAFNENNVLEPNKRGLPELPRQFAAFVEKLIGLEHEKFIEKYGHSITNIDTQFTALRRQSQQPAIQIVTPNIRNSSSSNQTVADKPIKIKLRFENDKIVYEEENSDFNAFNNSSVSNESKCRNCSQTSINAENRSFTNVIPKGQKLLTSYFPVVPKSKFNARPSNIEINKKINKYKCRFKTFDKQKRDTQYKNKNVLQKYLKKRNQEQFNRKRLYRKLSVIRKTFQRMYMKTWQKFKNHIDLLFAFICIKTFQKYTLALLRLYGLDKLNVKTLRVKRKINYRRTLDCIIADERILAIFRGKADEAKKMPSSTYLSNATTQNNIGNSTNTMATSMVGNESIAKRLQKSNKSADNVRLMLLPDNQHETAEKDFLFAQQYFDKVEETFLNENNHAKISEFTNILQSFDRNRDTAANLYLKLEQLFKPDHPELADFFLNFLLPSDAVELSKFMEHFMLTNKIKFLNKLNIFFHKQPAQIRKVLSCLKELANEEDLKLEKIQNKISPLLKGNQLLMDWFLECIGKESVPDGLPQEYETVSFSKGAEMGIDDSDMYENIPQSEIIPDPIESPCSIRYMNGKVYYGNRILLHAKLSFSLNDGHDTESIPMEDINDVDETNVVKQNNSNMTDSNMHQCVHDIKQYGDMKIREQSRNPFDNDQILLNDENDDSDDDSSGEMRCDVDSEGDYEIMSYSQASSSSSSSSSMVITTPLVQSTPPIPSEYLCDEVLLKAHGIRLGGNINLIQSNNEILRPAFKLSDRPLDLEKEARLSPKKQPTVKCSIASQSKFQRKSPISKKPQININKSPNTKKSLSPLLQQSLALMPRSPDSAALQTAKKLKRFLDSTDTQNSDKMDSSDVFESNPAFEDPRKHPALSMKVRTVVPKIPLKPLKILPPEQLKILEYLPINMRSMPDNEFETTNASDVQSLTSIPETELPSNNENIESVDKNSVTKKSEPRVTWSREEDRILLEQIKNGVATNMETIDSLSEYFDQKSVDDIKRRIDFLIDFLTKLGSTT